MLVYAICDGLTQESILLEDLDVRLFWIRLKQYKHAVLFVESAWKGWRGRWKYKVASYPRNKGVNNQKLVKLVCEAREKGIPTVFWNKEDSVHFDRFIDSARHFDHIFTVDSNCVARYREVVPSTTTVNVAMFPVQPRIHNYQGFNFKTCEASFVGSYSRHIHDLRRVRQNMLFSAALKAGLPVTVFDRNSNRLSRNYRYPADEFNLTVRPALKYAETADVYRNFLVSLNVNTIEDSPTMFSRRVVEVLACGGVLVSTPSMALSEMFKDYCHIVETEDEAVALFERMRHGPSDDDLSRARAGADFVLNNFTWKKFWDRIQAVVFQ